MLSYVLRVIFSLYDYLHKHSGVFYFCRNFILLHVLLFYFHFCSRYANHLDISADPLWRLKLKQDLQHISIR